jgi:hypothetical protein
MDKKIKEIEFVLENCECIKLPAEYIDMVITSDIKKYIHAQDTTFWYNYYTDYMLIKLLQKSKDFMSIRQEGSKISAWERLQHNDVTSVCFIFEDGTEDQIGVPWPKHSDWVNFNQNIKETDNLIIIEFNKKKLKLFGYSRSVIIEFFYTLKRKYNSYVYMRERRRNEKMKEHKNG